MKILRVILIILVAFLSLTAVAGGIGLLTGLNAPPVEMLAGSPFHSYVVPGLSLLVIVGGGALVATVLLARRHPWSVLAAAAMGPVIIFFEIVEILAIGSDPGVARTLQVFYLSLGTLILLLAGGMWMVGERGRRTSDSWRLPALAPVVAIDDSAIFLMRTIKEEEVALTEYRDYADAYRHIGRFLEDVYMRKRIHSSLGYLTPVEFEMAWLDRQAGEFVS